MKALLAAFGVAGRTWRMHEAMAPGLPCRSRGCAGIEIKYRSSRLDEEGTKTFHFPEVQVMQNPAESSFEVLQLLGYNFGRLQVSVLTRSAARCQTPVRHTWVSGRHCSQILLGIPLSTCVEKVHSGSSFFDSAPIIFHFIRCITFGHPLRA